jgi:hypothetical protein
MKIPKKLNSMTREEQEAWIQNQKRMNLDRSRKWRDANREKMNFNQRERRKVNKDRVLDYEQKYRDANREKLQERLRQHREANRAKMAALDHARYVANKEKYLDRSRQWSKKNRDRRIAWRRKWEKENPEIVLRNRALYKKRHRGKINESKRLRTKHMTDEYIATRLNVPASTIKKYPELLEAKREQIKILRELKPTTRKKKQNAQEPQ